MSQGRNITELYALSQEELIKKFRMLNDLVLFYQSQANDLYKKYGGSFVLDNVIALPQDQEERKKMAAFMTNEGLTTTCDPDGCMRCHYY